MSIKNKKGFTLLEILLVVGIIAILAGIVIVAINPSRQIAQARDSERKQMVSTINKAIVQFYIDTGAYPNIDGTAIGNTVTEICNTGSTASSTSEGNTANCSGLINLSQLVPDYLQSIPVDADGGLPGYETYGTSYKVGLNSGGNIYVEATRGALSQISVGSTDGVTGMSEGPYVSN